MVPQHCALTSAKAACVIEHDAVESHILISYMLWGDQGKRGEFLVLVASMDLQ